MFSAISSMESIAFRATLENSLIPAAQLFIVYKSLMGAMFWKV
tara:strand:- start:4111 stop:4239 length:129 start_codon:yes stop_codon:yes gene_type:complete